MILAFNLNNTMKGWALRSVLSRGWCEARVLQWHPWLQLAKWIGVGGQCGRVCSSQPGHRFTLSKGRRISFFKDINWFGAGLTNSLGSAKIRVRRSPSVVSGFYPAFSHWDFTCIGQWVSYRKTPWPSRMIKVYENAFILLRMKFVNASLHKVRFDF